MTLTGTITFTGKTLADVEAAIEEAARLISDGFTSGGDRNESGSFSISVEGTDDTEPVCATCGKNPGHNDVTVACYECNEPWNGEFCQECGHEYTEADIDGGRCGDCMTMITPLVPLHLRS